MTFRLGNISSELRTTLTPLQDLQLPEPPTNHADYIHKYEGLLNSFFSVKKNDIAYFSTDMNAILSCLCNSAANILTSTAYGKPLDAHGKVIDKITISNELNTLEMDLLRIIVVVTKALSSSKQPKSPYYFNLVEQCQLLDASALFMQDTVKNIKARKVLRQEISNDTELPTKLGNMIVDYLSEDLDGFKQGPIATEEGWIVNDIIIFQPMYRHFPSRDYEYSFSHRSLC